jgi:O-antigen ligase
MTWNGWLLPILLLIVALIAAIWSPNKTSSFGILKGWFLVPVVFAWVVNKNFNAKNIWKILVPLFVSLIVVSIWGILQKIGLISTLFYQRGDISFNQYISQGRSFGPFDSPNFLAMFVVPVVFLTLPIVAEIKSQTNKIIFLVSYVLPILALYFSGSRAGVIAFIIGLAVYINYRFINLQKAKKRQPFYSALFTAGLVVINFLYLFYATRIFTPTSGDDKLRVTIYHYSLDLLKKYNFWGLGLGQFQNKIGQISINDLDFQRTGLSYALHPHNLLLAIWLNLGLLGLVVFLWLIVSFFKNAFSSDLPIRAAVVAAMFAILIHGLFDTTYFKNDLSTIFWLVFIISVMIKNERN